MSKIAEEHDATLQRILDKVERIEEALMQLAARQGFADADYVKDYLATHRTIN